MTELRLQLAPEFVLPADAVTQTLAILVDVDCDQVRASFS